MTTPAYRLYVSIPRSQDPAEATALQPVAGAPHADYLKVTTLPGGIAAPAGLTAGMLSHSGMTAFTASKCVDGVLGSDQAWHTDSAVPGALIKVDLGAGNARAFQVCRIWVSTGAYAGIYDIEYSDNDSSWTKAFVGLAPRVVGTYGAAFWLPVGVHRYWRILLTNTPGGGSWLGELEFWEFGGPGAWKPYLHFPDVGRHGIVDVREKTSDTGVMYFDLLDPSLAPSDPLARFLPAFLGDLKGQLRSGGLVVRAQESLDLGVTWSAFWTGRVRTLEQRNPTRYRLGVRDMGDDLDALAFVGRPHPDVTYAAPAILLPIASTSIAYGRLLPLMPLKGTIQPHATYAAGRRISLDTTSRNRTDNIVTENLLEACPFGDVDLFARQAAGAAKPLARVRVKRLDTNAVDYFLAALTFASPYARYPVEQSRARILEIGILENGTAFPPNGTAVEVWIETEGEVSAEAPFLVSDVHCVTMIRHLVEGKFGFRYTSDQVLPPGKSVGDVTLPMPVDPVTFAALEADARLPIVRFVLTAREPRRDIIQRLCQMANLAYFLDGNGVFTLIDLRTPTDVSAVLTITDADLLAAPPAWEYDRGKAITRIDATYYLDVAQKAPRDESTFINSISTPRVGSTVKTIRRVLIITNVGTGELGDAPLDLDLPGFRYMFDDPDAQDRGTILERQTLALAYDTARPFGIGAPTLSLRCQRGGTGDAAPGALRKISVRSVPDPATNKLGGTRLVRVVERQERQAGIELQVLDLGSPTVAGTPTLGVPTVEPSNTTDGVTVPVTLNGAEDPVEIHYAITATSVGSAPAIGDALWKLIANGLVRTAGNTTFRGLSAGKRIWVRGRSFPDVRANYQLPSAWVAASSPGRVDLFGLAVPQAPTGSLQSSRTFRISWMLATNWALHSEAFDHADWSKYRSSVTPDAVAAPDGKTTADKLVEDATASATHGLVSAAAVTILSGEEIAVSCFAKADTRTKLRIEGVSTDSFGADFDLGAGTVIGTVTSGAGTITGGATISSVGNGWYRLAVVGKINGGRTTGFLNIQLLDSAGAPSYNGNGSSGLYIWGGQFERGATAANPYLATPTAPASAAVATEILLATPTSDARVVVARVPPGSTYYDFPGDTNVILQPSTTYRVGLRHTDGVGSISAEITVDVTTTASDPDIELPHPPRQFF